MKCAASLFGVPGIKLRFPYPNVTPANGRVSKGRPGGINMARVRHSFARYPSHVGIHPGCGIDYELVIARGQDDRRKAVRDEVGRSRYRDQGGAIAGDTLQL